MYLKPILLAALAALVLFVAVILTKTPRHDLVWADDVSRLAGASREGDVFSIADYRTWTYDTEGPTEKAWRAAGPYRISDVRRAWFAVEPHPGFGGQMAHTMVVFEFAGGDVLGLSVEARKERGEPYGVLAGSLNAFELTYVWAAPRDMFGRRVRVQDHRVYMYPLALSPAETRAYLGALLDRTIAIQDKPRFYNTLASNCTNELAKTAGLNWHPAFVLTGNSAKALHGMGRLSGDGDYAAAKARADVTDWVAVHDDLDEAAFNAGLIDVLDRTDK